MTYAIHVVYIYIARICCSHIYATPATSYFFFFSECERRRAVFQKQDEGARRERRERVVSAEKRQRGGEKQASARPQPTGRCHSRVTGAYARVKSSCPPLVLAARDYRAELRYMARYAERRRVKREELWQYSVTLQRI